MTEVGLNKKLMLLSINKFLQAQSISGTRFIAKRYGSLIGFTYVGGYPKSGTTWVSQMVAHYLDLPLVEPPPRLPLTFKCVVHNHWEYHPAFDRAIYVIRDGRDVMVSLYMTVVRGYVATRKALDNPGTTFLVRTFLENLGKKTDHLRRLHRLFGRKFDPWDISRNLPLFIEDEMKHPFLWAVRQPWPQHVQTWRAMAKSTIFVKYEDMLCNSATTLSDVLRRYLQQEVSAEAVTYTVQRYSFKRQAGRQQGVEDRTSFFRKGVQGDWTNHFTKEAAHVFDHYAGDLLIELGYETEHQWVDSLQEV